MYERIRKRYCKKIMEADNVEVANMILALLNVEDEVDITKPISEEDRENLLDWDESLKGMY